MKLNNLIKATLKEANIYALCIFMVQMAYAIFMALCLIIGDFPEDELPMFWIVGSLLSIMAILTLKSFLHYQKFESNNDNTQLLKALKTEDYSSIILILILTMLFLGILFMPYEI